jgi:RHS repeat-associated protein
VAPVVVNRTVPNVTAPAAFAGFSSSPSDDEFFRGRIFEEPLVPIGRATTGAENRALADALEIYRRGAPEATASLDVFLQAHPDTPWRASLLANVGARLRDAGTYTRALAMWDEAWTLARDATDPHGRAMADFALTEWLRLSMSLMQIDQVEARLASIGERDVRGTAGNRVRQVRELLAAWRVHPERFVPAEWRALERLSSVESGRKGGKATASSTRATVPNAIKVKAVRPLGWLIGPAKKLGLTLQAMRRGASARFAAGAIVPMKNGQILALLESRGDRFLAYDPLLNRDLSVSRATLEEDASEFVLMSRAPTPASGWTEVAAAALPMQATLCPPGTPDDHEPCPCAGGAGGPGGPPGAGGPPPADPGMPTYRLHHSIAGLVIQDEPLRYSVPRGPSPRLGLSYGSRMVENPAVFTFGNFGPKWRFDWLAYIQERPVGCWNYGACIDPELRVTLRGGGMESYEPPGGSWTTLGPHWRSHAVIVRTSSSPLQYERRLPDGSKEVYGVSEGTFPGARLFLTDLVDPQGQTLHLTYDSQFRLVSLTDAIGQVSSLSYEHATDPLKITKVTDPFGRFATFTYNTAGQLESITDVIGLTSSFAYGPNDFIVGMTTPYGTTTFREEDTFALTPRYLEATDPMGGTERVEYWLEHASLPATVPASEVPAGLAAANHSLNQFVSLYWDKRAMALQPRALTSAAVTKWLVRTSTPDYSGGAPNTSIPYYIKRPLEGRVWYRYPNQFAVSSPEVGTGMQPSITARVLDDGSSQISQASYNTLGHVTSRTDPLGRRTSYVYAANNIDLIEMRQTTGSMNDLLATYSDYNAQHRPQIMTDAAGQTSTLTYSTNGAVLTVTNAKNETTTYAYDSAGHGYLQSVNGPVAGAATTYTYDAFGRVRTSTDSGGYTLTRDYDSLNRLIKTTYPGGTYEQQTYHRLDRVESRDRLGRIRRYIYDAQRRLVSTRDPLGRTITQQWCACGSLDAVIDAKGQMTVWQRDLQGRITREKRADGTTETAYAYEATTSRLKAVTDPKLQVTTLNYNVDGMLGSIVFTNAAVTTPTVSITYDASYKRKVSMTDGTGTTTYSYHAPGVLGAGKVASEDGPLTDDTLVYAYDELGRVASQLLDGVGSAYTYDALGRISTEINPLGTFMLAYDGATLRLTSVLYPNGQTLTQTWLGAASDHRLQTMHNRKADTSTLSRYDFTYDAIGNVLTRDHQVDSQPPEEWTYRADDINQLVGVVRSSTGPGAAILERYAYDYDRLGNRTTEQIGEAASQATYDVLNRLTERRPGGSLRFAGSVSEPATVSIQGTPAVVDSANNFSGTSPTQTTSNLVTIEAKDASGNVGAAKFQVTLSGSTHNYTYDANGNLAGDGVRTFEWDARNQLVAVTVGLFRSEFTYDGLQRRTKVVEKNNGSTVSETFVKWCGEDICEERGSDGVTVSRRLFARGEWFPNGLRFFSFDHIGNVVEVTDTSNTLLARHDYDPWGRRTLVSGTEVTTTGYTGHSMHSNGELWLAKFRAYDAHLGRWLSQDPQGMSDGPNLYAYVSNGPNTHVDPDGLSGINWPPGAYEASVSAGCLGYYGKLVNDKYRPNEQNNRYAHCLASCLIQKNCGTAEAYAAEYGKEVLDVIRCGTGREASCSSAFDGNDRDDNETGRICPKSTDCFQWCADLKDKPDKPKKPWWR